MPRRTPEGVLAYSARAWEMKRRWYSEWWECWQYAAPGLNPYATGSDPAYQRTMGPVIAGQYAFLFDSTMPRAVAKTPHRMVEEMFPPGRDWVNFEAGALLRKEGVSQKQREQVLKDAQRDTFTHLHATGVSLELVKMVRDAFVTGTGLMKVGVSPDNAQMLHFEAVNQAQVALEPGPMGRVWAFYRKAEMPRDHIIATWPDATNLPVEDEVEQDMRQPKLWKIVEAIYYEPATGVWYMDVVMENADGGGMAGATRIFERDYPVCPWIVYRYSQLAGEVQGRSPVMDAKPDARTLNHAKMVRLQSASIRVGGIYTYLNDGTFNPRMARMQSGAFLPVGSNDRQNPTVRELPLAGDVQMGELISEDLVGSIKETLGDIGLPEPGASPPTATQIIEQAKDARLMRGIPYLRMQHEIGIPLMRASVWHLSQMGQLEGLQLLQQVGEEVEAGAGMQPLRMDGTDMALRFTSPHVQAQKLTEVQGLVEASQMSQAAAGQEAFLRSAKVEEITPKIFELMDQDPKLTRDEEERAELMQASLAAQTAQPGAAPVQGELPLAPPGATA